MFVGKDAADGGQGSKGSKENINDDTEWPWADVAGEVKGDERENSSNHHDVSRREGRLARAVGAGVPDKELVEDEVGDCHKNEGDEHFKKGSIDFCDGFFRDELAQPECRKGAERGDGGDKGDISGLIPIHGFIISQNGLLGYFGLGEDRLAKCLGSALVAKTIKKLGVSRALVYRAIKFFACKYTCTSLMCASFDT